MEGVPGVLPLRDQHRVRNIQRTVQNMCDWKRYVSSLFRIQVIELPLHLYQSICYFLLNKILLKKDLVHLIFFF